MCQLQELDLYEVDFLDKAGLGADVPLAMSYHSVCNPQALLLLIYFFSGYVSIATGHSLM